MSWVKRNLVILVTVPLIIGIHYGWGYLQQNETLVPPHEKKDDVMLPLEATAKVYGFLTGKFRPGGGS